MSQYDGEENVHEHLCMLISTYIISLNLAKQTYLLVCMHACMVFLLIDPYDSNAVDKALHAN